jgi:hypothetical protein
MKQILYIITSVFTLLCITSCEISSGDKDIANERTLAGRYIIEVVERNLNSYIYLLDMALKFDTYLQAEEKEKERILKYLLPGHQHFEKGDTIYFEERGQNYNSTKKLWSIVRASTDSLSSPSSSWSMGFSSSDNTSLSLDGFALNGNGQRNTWVLDIKNHEANELSEGSFEINKLTNRKLNATKQVNDYSIATKPSTFASINSKKHTDFEDYQPESIRIKYQLTTPFYLKFIQSERYPLFVEGNAVMDIEQGESPTNKEHVTAEINQSDYEFVTIQYKGVTELHRRNLYIYGNY